MDLWDLAIRMGIGIVILVLVIIFLFGIIVGKLI